MKFALGWSYSSSLTSSPGRDAGTFNLSAPSALSICCGMSWAQLAEIKGSSGTWPLLPALCPVSPAPLGTVSQGSGYPRKGGDQCCGAGRSFHPGSGFSLCVPCPQAAPCRANGILEQQPQQKSASVAAVENYRLCSLGLPPACLPPGRRLSL